MKKEIERIEELSKVSDINTCWSVLSLCEGCLQKDNCNEQSPIIRLNEINKLICEVKSELVGYNHTDAEYNQAIEGIIQESFYKDKYKQALKDIKEIINKIDDSVCAYGDYNCKDCDDEGDTLCAGMIKKLILEKCKVVK